MGLCLLVVTINVFEPRREKPPGASKCLAAALQGHNQTWSDHLPGVLSFGQHRLHHDISTGS